MFAEERYDYILKKLKETGSVTVNDVSAALSVSAETVRRDLILLETHGKLRRVFGGAVVSDRQRALETIAVRLDKNTDLKTELSRYAVRLIDEGDTVAVDSGSTANEFAKVLKANFKELTVVTHSNTVFRILGDKFRVILAGGEYTAYDDCFLGPLTENFLKDFHVDKAVIFPAALSPEHGIESFASGSAAIQRIFISIADQVLVLADSAKIGAHALIKATDMSDDFIYVTDSHIDPSVKRTLSDGGYMVISSDNGGMENDT